MNITIIRNPELLKNIWLDFSWHRSLITLLIISLIVTIFSLSGSTNTAAGMAHLLACFFIFFLGIKKASETVIEEINNATWDFQRQSAMSPWTLAMGKLWGSTLFSWYGALISCGIYIYLANSVPHSQWYLQRLGLAILGGLAGQGAALLFSVLSIPRLHTEKSLKSFRFFILGLFIGIVFTTLGFNALSAAQESIKWYQFTVSSQGALFLSLFMVLLWEMIGLKRVFAEELQYQQIPWIWALFNLFWIVYIPGFLMFDQSITLPETPNVGQYVGWLINHSPYYVAFLISLMMTYAALFCFPISLVQYGKLFARIVRYRSQPPGHLEVTRKDILTEIPLWPISYAFALILSLVILWTHPPTAAFEDQNFQTYSIGVFALTWAGFVLRDILLFHVFYLVPNTKRALLNVILYLFLLYYLLPGLLAALHFTNVIHLFSPSFGEGAWITFGSLVVQLGLLGTLCYGRWKKSSALLKT